MSFKSSFVWDSYKIYQDSVYALIVLALKSFILSAACCDTCLYHLIIWAPYRLNLPLHATLYLIINTIIGLHACLERARWREGFRYLCCGHLLRLICMAARRCFEAVVRCAAIRIVLINPIITGRNQLLQLWVFCIHRPRLFAFATRGLITWQGAGRITCRFNPAMRSRLFMASFQRPRIIVPLLNPLPHLTLIAAIINIALGRFQFGLPLTAVTSDAGCW